MRVIRDRLVANLNDRAVGRALCSIAAATPEGISAVRESLSAFLRESYAVDLRASDLKPISAEVAHAVATELLMGPIWGPRPEDSTAAGELATRFFSQFDAQAEFFSTYHYKINPDATCTATGVALLDTSFELGVLVGDGARVGILWVGDED